MNPFSERRDPFSERRDLFSERERNFEFQVFNSPLVLKGGRGMFFCSKFEACLPARQVRSSKLGSKKSFETSLRGAHFSDEAICIIF